MAVSNLRQVFYDVIVAMLVMLFAYTAFHKIMSWTEFADQMRNQPLPLWLSSILTWTIPVLSIAIIFLLLVSPARHIGLIVSFLLLFGFDIYIAAILGGVFSYVPCSCAGITSSLSWGAHFVVNVIMMAFCAAGYFLQKNMKSI